MRAVEENNANGFGSFGIGNRVGNNGMMGGGSGSANGGPGLAHEEEELPPVSAFEGVRAQLHTQPYASSGQHVFPGFARPQG